MYLAGQSNGFVYVSPDGQAPNAPIYHTSPQLNHQSQPHFPSAHLYDNAAYAYNSGPAGPPPESWSTPSNPQHFQQFPTRLNLTHGAESSQHMQNMQQMRPLRSLPPPLQPHDGLYYQAAASAPSTPSDFELDSWHGVAELEGAFEQLKACPERFNHERIPDHLLMPFLEKIPLPPSPSEPPEKDAGGKGIREGAKQYNCRWYSCDKSFTRADHARDHIRGHINNKPYPCEYW